MKKWVAATAISLVATLSGCTDRDLPECGDAIKSRLTPHNFELFDGGIAQNKDNGVFVTRCAAGQSFRNYRCKGDSLKLSWDEAMGYASEVAEKTGESWRLPDYSEMQSMLEIGRAHV